MSDKRAFKPGDFLQSGTSRSTLVIQKAKELGLVDNLGSINDAIKAAAKRASLEEGQYDTWFVKRELSKNEQLIKQLLNSSASDNIETESVKPNTLVNKLMLDMQSELKKVQQFNDPNHAYIHCNCVID